MIIPKVSCRYCVKDHHVVCDCGHPHDHHLLFGHCRRVGCKCERYSQVMQRLPGETFKALMKRKMSRREFAKWWRKEKVKIVETGQHQLQL